MICGRGGGDAIFGLGGNDILRGGAGDDALIGGEGDDKLVGGQGDDRTEQDPQPNGDENWQINAKTGYRVLVDTKIEWRVKAKSENCTADTSNWDNTRTASDQVFTQRALITANNSPGRSCAYERSYATWTVTVRQPGGEVVTAEVKITSGPPNGLVHVGDAECTVPSGWRCRTDSDWVFAGTGSVPNPWVAIGNM